MLEVKGKMNKSLIIFTMCLSFFLFMTPVVMGQTAETWTVSHPSVYVEYYKCSDGLGTGNSEYPIFDNFLVDVSNDEIISGISTFIGIRGTELQLGQYPSWYLSNGGLIDFYLDNTYYGFPQTFTYHGTRTDYTAEGEISIYGGDGTDCVSGGGFWEAVRNPDAPPVPEISTMSMVMVGITGLFILVRRGK